MYGPLKLNNHILLNERAYFFRSDREPITDLNIKQVFNEVLEGLSYKILTRIVRQLELITSENSETQAHCSLLVFRHIALPSMFDFDEDNCPSELKEAKISYLSKESLKKAFNKLKRGETFKQRNSVIQLVWLLNGFISTCKQADLNCRIFCKK